MKAGWEIKSLDNVTNIINGGTPKSGVSHFWGGDVAWLTPKDMGKLTDIFVADTFRTITQEGLAKSSAKLIPKDSVILSTRAPIGHLAINSVPMAFNQGCRGLVPKDKLILKYLFYFLSANIDVMNELGSGTTFKELSAGALKSIEIPLPPLEEQKRIVSILDEAFEGLDRARENAEANLKSARELFESVLFSVFGTMSEKNDLFLLKEVSKDFARGKSKHRPRNDKSLYGGDYPFIQTGDVRNAGHRITAFSTTYNEKGLAQSKLWPSGTVCITIAANIAETSILSFDACFPDSVIGMVPDETKTSSDYMEYVLQFFQKRLKAVGEGAAQDNINLKTFESEYFPFPSLSKQASAISKLNTASKIHQKVREKYISKLQDISDLRQSLLQRAFAGELT